MADKEKKMAVLNQLELLNEPVSISHLLEKLGGNFLERTVRRWLLELVRDGLVERTGIHRSTKYQLKPVNISGIQLTHPFSFESLALVNKIRQPLTHRMPQSYNDEWLKKYQPNQDYYLPLTLRLQLRLSGKRTEPAEPAGTYAQQIFNRLLIDLSYNSSRLEGNTYSLLDTQKLLLEGVSPQGKLDEETVMILNHKEAIRYLVDSVRTLSITKETILTLHFLLSDGLVDSKYAGKIRDGGVRIGGSVCIPYENPMLLDENLEIILSKASQIIDPYEQSIFLLIHLSYLQAFVDVNKRTARLCANIPLIKNNLVPLSFNDVEKEDYISAIIAIYELQDIGPLTDLYVFSYLRTCLVYDSTIKAIGFDQIRVRYRAERRLLIREIVIQKLTNIPLKLYLHREAENLVPQKDLKNFIEDVEEDFREISPSRIAGLGITTQELEDWLLLQKKSLT